jgi:hypothetical protein
VTALGTSAAKQTQLLPSVPQSATRCPDSTGRLGRHRCASGDAEGNRRAACRRTAEDRRDAEFREQLFKFGMEPLPAQTPEQFATTIKAELPRWAKAIKDSGAKVD